MKLSGLMLILALFVGTLQAQPRSFSDWTMGRQSGEEGLFAATQNDSGNILGKYCFAELASCVYLLGMKTSCVKGNRYPVLVNASTGSETLEVYCGGALGSLNLYQYIFSDFDKINRTVLEASKVGFAVPLHNDQFNVVRFSLIGSNEAIDAMTQAYRRSGTPGRSNTRDQRL